MASNDIEVLDPATSVEKLKDTESGVALDRRHFLTALGVAGAAAGVMVGSGLLSSGPTAVAQQPKPSGYQQLDVMNFLMNIKYLKATLYAFLTTGLDIPANYPTPNPTGPGTSGTVVATSSSPIYSSGQIYNPPAKVTFPNQQITDLFNEMYYDEVSQLIDLRNLIGDVSGDVIVGARPSMDMLGTGNKTTTTATTMTYQQAVGYARMLEDLSVSAFIGASVYLTGQNLAYVTQILAANGYHAGALRLISIQQSIPYIGTSYLTTTATGTQSLNTYTGSLTTGSPIIYITPVTNAPIIGNPITGIGVPVGAVITGYAPAANSTFTAIANNAASPNNPNVLTVVSSVSGLAPGQPISGTDIATGAYITGIGTNTVTMSAAATGTATVAPTGYTTNTSASITGVSSISGITVGQAISGTGIPSTATVAAASGTTITLSTPATATSQVTPSGILTNGSTTITSVSSVSGINSGQPITGTGIPSGTTVSATGTNTITMSKAATASTTQTPTSFTGTQTTGSAVVTNVSSFTNLAVGQPVSGTNVQPGTTITVLNASGASLTLSIAPAGTALQPLTPTGILTPSTSVITGVSSTAGVLPGQPIAGTGIPANTVVTSTTATTINMGILLSGIVTNGSSTVTSLSTTTGSAATTGLVVGQTITGANIPANTTITAINTTSPATLTLSNPATGSSGTAELLTVAVNATDTIQGIVVAGDPVVASGPTVPLNAIAGLAAGQSISGTGIPAGTVISSIGTGTLTMSNPATISSFVAETLTISVPTPVSLTISVQVAAVALTATTTQTLTIPTTVTLKVPSTVTVTVGRGTLTISQPAVGSGVQTLTMLTGDLMDVEPFDPGTAALAAAGPSAIPIPASTYSTSGPTTPLVYQGFFNTAGTGTASGSTPAGFAFVRSFGQTLSVLLGSTQTNPITYQGGFFPVGVNGPINANVDQ